MPDNPENLQSTEQQPAANPQTRFGPNGRYESLEAWETATRASEQESSRLARELQEERTRRQQYESVFQQNQPVDPYKELDTLGVPSELLRSAMRSELQQVLAPLAQMQAARAKIMGENPDYEKHESKMDAYVFADAQMASDYNALAQVNPYRALEWKIGVYRAKHQNSNGAEQHGANLPGNTAPDNRGDVVKGTADRQERLEKSLDYARAYGDTKPYRDIRFQDELKKAGVLPENS